MCLQTTQLSLYNTASQPQYNVERLQTNKLAHIEEDIRPGVLAWTYLKNIQNWLIGVVSRSSETQAKRRTSPTSKSLGAQLAPPSESGYSS
jgi:hypothetical protein